MIVRKVPRSEPIPDHDGYSAHNTVNGQPHDPKTCADIWRTIEEWEPDDDA